jgi:hypothetical protein
MKIDSGRAKYRRLDIHSSFTDTTREVVSKRFCLVKVKADDHFNRRNTLSISRIEM